MSNIGKSETFDPLTGEKKETLFRAYFNHAEKRGEFSRATRHQTHGIFFRLVDKPDPKLGSKKAILVTAYERSDMSNSIYPDMAVTVELCDLVHRLLGIDARKEEPSITRFDSPEDEMNIGVRVPEEVLARIEDVSDRYGGDELEEFLVSRISEAVEEFAVTKGRARVAENMVSRPGALDPEAGPGALDKFYPEGA